MSEWKVSSRNGIWQIFESGNPTAVCSFNEPHGEETARRLCTWWNERELGPVTSRRVMASLNDAE